MDTLLSIKEIKILYAAINFNSVDSNGQQWNSTMTSEYMCSLEDSDKRCSDDNCGVRNRSH